MIRAYSLSPSTDYDRRPSVVTHSTSPNTTRDLDTTLLFRDARRIVRSDDIAWDVVQETLLTDHLHYPGQQSPLPALRKLCALIARSHNRASARRQSHESDACKAYAHSDTGKDPLDDAQNAELSELLTLALEELPATQRTVFELYELEGHNYSCIAEQLSLPVGTVRSRLARARTGMRHALERTACEYTEGFTS
jgi:RNA polymerase sigma-70 factor (ECF subfamily)